MIGGGATGLGIATGLAAGICSTLRAVQGEGIMTAAQAEQVLVRKATDLVAMSGAETAEGIVGSASDRETVPAQLSEAA